MLPVARLISGSSTANVAVLTVVVSPDTVKSPEIVTLFGNPTVIVPELSETVTWLLVPAKVIVPPNAVAVVFDPSETVIVELLNDELPIFDNVLSAPDIVLFVSVSVVALPTSVSVAAGIVSVFEPEACCNEAITGVVKVLFVSVTVFVNVANESSDNALLKFAVEPVIVFEANDIDLLVRVFDVAAR